MKVICIMGSPRKQGNTAKALSWVEAELRAKGHQVEHVDIVDLKIGGCVECYYCQGNPDQPLCAQKDDANALFERMMAADAIVYASPLFCWEFSAQIKPFIDRHFCLSTGYGGPNHKSAIEGRKAALLVTAAGPVEGNADLIVEVFERMANYVKTPVAGHLVIPFCTTPEEMGESVRAEARALANNIITS
jgi:multimeric flavodoxin WrbA